jgi:hypothetical protein
VRRLPAFLLAVAAASPPTQRRAPRLFCANCQARTATRPPAERGAGSRYMTTLGGAKGFGGPGWLTSPYLLEQKA